MTTVTETKLSFTYDQALALLNRAVEEKGSDYVYPGAHDDYGCRYFNPETARPDCIVGHVFSYAGKGFSNFESRNESGVDSLVDSGVIEADTRTCRLLNTAQELQDTGTPWGEAVKCAVETADTWETEF